jgi:hypothetical protein
MMKSITCYIITPTVELVRLCTTWQDKSLAECLCESLVWTSEEGGLSDTSEEVRIARTKLLSVARVFSEFTNARDLLGSPDISIDTFDRFWSIMRIEPEGTLDDLCSDSADALRDGFTETGIALVDDWLKAVGEK